MQCVKKIAATAPEMLEAFETLVLLSDPGGQPCATEILASRIILGHDAAEVHIEILHGLNQTKDSAASIVNRDILEARSQARGGVEAVGAASLERQVNAGDLIEVIENDQCCLVVQQGDSASFQPAAFLLARKQA